MKCGCARGILPPISPLLGAAGGIFLVCVLGACPSAAPGPEIPAFTVRFDTGPEGSAVPSQTVGEGEKIETPDPPANANRYLEFKEWRTGDGTEGEWKKVWNFAKNTVHEDMTLYARWIESAARNEGIWRSADYAAVYLLQGDGGAWYIDWYGVQHTQWNGAAIGGEEAEFSGEAGARELNARNAVFKRVSPAEDPPAPLGDAAIAGRYIGGDYGAGQYTAVLELGFDGFGTLRSAGGALPLAYRAEADALLLLEHGYPHRVLLWLPVSGGYIGEFAREKAGGRESLAGVWEAEGAAYTLGADGAGIYHLWGAELPFAYSVVEDQTLIIEGNRAAYDLFNGSVLTVYGGNGEVRYSSAQAPPLANPAPGDPALAGTWVFTDRAANETYALSFGVNGLMELTRSGTLLYRYIWRAQDGEILTGSPGMGQRPLEANGLPYELEDGTLYLFEVSWKRQ